MPAQTARTILDGLRLRVTGTMKGWAMAGAVALLLFGATRIDASAEPASGIRIYPHNPYYWQYDGKPVLLLGGSVEDNLFQIPNLTEHLDALVAAGGNYVRCTMSSRDQGDVWPFKKTGGLYDLDQWNQEYWTRFAAFLRETRRRDVIVQIEVWATFDFYRDIWARNPFNPKNNSTYTAHATGLPQAVHSHPTRTDNNFFWSVPAENNQQIVLKYQYRFVDKLLSHSLKYDHVLYCMDNETSVTAEWGAYWSKYIQQAAAKADKKVYTTEMWDPHDLRHPMHRATYEHPGIYGFVEISQNNHQRGQVHYDRALELRRKIADAPRPLNQVKIYGADTGPFGAASDGVQRFWRSVFAGAAAARFHRPSAGLGLGDTARRMIRSARDVVAAIDIFRCEPRPDLLADREPNEAYCLANPGEHYAVYFPDGGDVVLTLGSARAAFELRWYDIQVGRWTPPLRVPVGESIRLEAPAAGQWAAVVRPKEQRGL